MADVVHVKAPDLELAATTVAQHIETAATPPSTAAPLQTAVASPVDGAASGAAGAIRAKMAALSAEMAPKGSADGAAAAVKALKDYEAKNHTRVIRQQIKVAIIDPKTGQPMLARAAENAAVPLLRRPRSHSRPTGKIHRHRSQVRHCRFDPHPKHIRYGGLTADAGDRKSQRRTCRSRRRR
jgi:hypothetical protein